MFPSPKIFYILLIFIFFTHAHAQTQYPPDIKKYLEFFNQSCGVENDYVKNENSRPNTLLLIDATTPLNDNQKQFIVDNFINSFEYSSKGEKISLVLLNQEPLSSMNFFTICSPLPESKIKATMATKILKQDIKVFNDSLKGGFEALTKSNQEAQRSPIIESLVEIFRNDRYGFKSGKRKIIIASDLYQHSDFLSFNEMCNKSNCEVFGKSMQRNNFKDLMDSVVKFDGSDDVQVDIFHLKTKNRVNLKSKNWWLSFFEHTGFKKDKVRVITQL